MKMVIFGILLLMLNNNLLKAEENSNQKNSTPMALTNFEVIKLQQPDLDSENHLMKALKDRKSDRDFSTENLSLKHLSEIMWAAYGKNREDGKRTVPSAVALYPIKMYAVLSNGIYLYEPDKHELIPVVEGDYREFTGMPIAKVAPLNLVLIADYNKYQNTGNEMIDGALKSPERRLRFASLDAGHSTPECISVLCFGRHKGFGSWFGRP